MNHCVSYCISYTVLGTERDGCNCNFELLMIMRFWVRGNQGGLIGIIPPPSLPRLLEKRGVGGSCINVRCCTYITFFEGIRMRFFLPHCHAEFNLCFYSKRMRGTLVCHFVPFFLST